MDWITIATLIARYGIPFAEHIIENAQNNKPVNPAEWSALKAKIQTSYDDIGPAGPRVA